MMEEEGLYKDLRNYPLIENTMQRCYQNKYASVHICLASEMHCGISMQEYLSLLPQGLLYMQDSGLVYASLNCHIIGLGTHIAPVTVHADACLGTCYVP